MEPLLNADLHCHSVVSDGTLTPEALASRAKANGVQLWALTDHDEIGGQARAMAAAKAEVVNWVLKKPMAEQRDLIQESIARSVKAADMLVQGEMEKATVQIHTSKPPRPKPPRPEGV